MCDNNPLDLPVINSLQQLLGDNIQSLLKTFISSSDQQLIQIDLAIREKDIETISRILHSLKGRSGSLGASCLYQLCLKLEEKIKLNELDQLANWHQQLNEEYDRYKQAISLHLKYNLGS